MKTTTIQFIIIYLLLLAFFAYIKIFSGNDLGYVYVNTAKIYNEFEMKQQLEKKLQAVQFARKSVLDSLMLELKIINGKLKINPKDETLNKKFLDMKSDYIEKETFFNEDTKRQGDEYETQIWNQLNQYVKEYGILKKHRMVLGADGRGSLMYAEDGLDISEEIVKYANEKYRGNLK